MNSSNGLELGDGGANGFLRRLHQCNFTNGGDHYVLSGMGSCVPLAVSRTDAMGSSRLSFSLLYSMNMVIRVSKFGEKDMT